MFHLSIPLHSGLEQGEVVGHLCASHMPVGIADVTPAHGGDRDDRTALGLGADDARDGIGGAGSRAGHHYPRLACDARVTVGKVSGCRLVARHDKPHIQLVSETIQGLKHHHIRPVRDGVDKAHPLGMQASYQ